MVKYFYNKFKRKLNIYKFKNLVPKNPHHNDIYLVSSPKSGVTWLSFLMSNCMKNNNSEFVTFYNHHKYVVDIHQLRNSEISANYPLDSYRLLKSHSKYNSYYYFVIYLLRNPFDVMLSYYYFMSSSGYVDNFENFIESPIFGIRVWAGHVCSWLIDNKDLSQRIHILRFEDLLDNTKHQLDLIFKNIGLTIDEGKIDRAIELSSKMKMKTSENIYTLNNPVYKNSKMKFIRKGTKRQKDKIMSNKAKSIILSESDRIIRYFYPDEVF